MGPAIPAEAVSTDTIVAVATAWGEAGIAIVRLSGPDAVKLAETVVQFKAGLGFPPPRLLRLASLVDEEKRAVDQVLAVRFAAPKSYTGEDVVEIHTHGGILAAQVCLEALVRHGARLAEPGEFTQRAFLNGRIDLSQSESVLGIIRSRSEEALRAAARTLSGELSALAAGLREELLALQSALEVELDFPEEALPYRSSEELLASLSALRGNLEELAERCSAGLLLREGVRVVLAGRPNVGKSSLLNALLKRERAIVTSLPGTTRDVIEEPLVYRGVPLRLVDTAGLRAPSDEIEASGIRRTRDELRRSDICLWILDGSAPLDEEGRKDIEQLGSKKGSENFEAQECLILLNKSDLNLSPDRPAAEEELRSLLPPERRDSVLRISAKTGEGLEILKERILSLATGGGTLEAGFNVTARQLGEVREALLAVSDAEAAAIEGSGQDLIAALLAASRESLERLLGLSCDDALLDSIFSRFCVGK